MKNILTRHNLLMIALAVGIACAWQVGMISPETASFAGLLGIMSNTQARVIDPVLSTIAQGYQNNELIFPELFPVVPVDQRGGKIISFNKEDFRLYGTARAPGANTKRVSFGYSGLPYVLTQQALEGLVPIEHMQEANAVPGIDMARIAVLKVQNIIQLGNEVAAAAIATTAASYQAANKATLAGTSQWSDQTSGISNPSKDIQTAVEAVRAATGKRANKVVLGPKVWASLKSHPLIIDRIKYTGRDSITLEMLAALWDVKKVVVGDAIYEDAAGALADVWGKFVVVAYTETGSLMDAGLPSYGYTYRLRNTPLVETPYYDNSAKSWIYPVTDELSPVAAAINAGYLLSAVVA